MPRTCFLPIWVWLKLGYPSPPTGESEKKNYISPLNITENSGYRMMSPFHTDPWPISLVNTFLTQYQDITHEMSRNWPTKTTENIRKPLAMSGIDVLEVEDGDP